MLIAISVGAVTNLICNSVLIPRYAENGAAIATVVAETVVAVISFVNASKFFNMREVFKSYWQYWVAAVPIPAGAILMRALPLNYIVRICLVITLSTAVYFRVLYLLNNSYFLDAVRVVTKKLHRKGDG